MKKLFTMALAVGMLCNAQAADLYKASRNVALRAPAVPLITSDPYLSIWSPTDALNESSTMHWTGTEHPLLGAIRVDGKTYRFMGKDKLNLETLVPMTDTDTWQGSYTSMSRLRDGTPFRSMLPDGKRDKVLSVLPICLVSILAGLLRTSGFAAISRLTMI